MTREKQIQEALEELDDLQEKLDEVNERFLKSKTGRAFKLLHEIVVALGYRVNLSVWETTILKNAKEILNDEQSTKS